MRLQALHCPNCGAAIGAAGGPRVTCGYCRLTLAVEHERVTSPRPAPAPADDASKPLYPPPEATSFSVESERFELSVVEQKIAGAPPQLWKGLDLDAGRFALVELRLVDAQGHPAPGELESLLEIVRESLQADRDPGLAANLALEQVQGAARLEAGIILFDPDPMTAVVYQAGCGDAAWWLSQEEGRAITLNRRNRRPLERRMLREARDHFSNDAPLPLASGDLVVWLSAGVIGRGDTTRYPIGVQPLLEGFNENLGEEPLRVVTLAKNACWTARAKSAWQREAAPGGDVVIAGVRAIPPELATALPGPGSVEVLRTRRFEVALRRTPGDAVALHPLHADRATLVWLAPRAEALPGDALEKASRAVREVLDANNGDNENARLAGRRALAALGVDVNLAVVMLGDAHGKVAYFTHGWRLPLQLPEREGSASMQVFDGGGEAWPHVGGRLLFPGALPLRGPAADPAQLATVWPGGKASRLYQAARDHWKTKVTERALEKLGCAAASDSKPDALPGLALITLVG